MRTSRAKFVLIFLVLAFAFQFISNSVLGPDVRLFPLNGEPFPGRGSPIGWKNTAATIIYPIKLVLIGPLQPLFKLPDPPPPLVLFAFILYWTVLALLLYELLRIITKLKRS